MAGRQESLWIFAMKVNLLMTKQMAPFPFKYWSEFDCHFGRVSMFQIQYEYGIQCGNPYFCCKNKNVKLSITGINWSRQRKKRELSSGCFCFWEHHKRSTLEPCAECVLFNCQRTGLLARSPTENAMGQREDWINLSHSWLAKGSFIMKFSTSPCKLLTWQFSKRKLRLQLTIPMV